MPSSETKSWVQIERRHWLYWLSAFVLIIALSITVYLLYTRMIHDLADVSQSRWVGSSYYTGIGLVGLIGVFVLHTLLRQIELSSLRKTLKQCGILS